MKLINPSVEILPQIITIDDAYSAIEIAGRNCYKSENKITETSKYDFVEMIKTKNHLSVLEFGIVYLYIPDSPEYFTLIEYFRYNKYSIVYSANGYCNITTNMRVIFENNLLERIEKFICNKRFVHEDHISFRIICSRYISHALVRHRNFSFAQESTRFCNYSKDKFNNVLTFIKPFWFDDADTNLKKLIIDMMDISEQAYLQSIEKTKLKPEEARDFLLGNLKTEIIMSGTVSNWYEFINKRITPVNSPEMIELVKLIKKQINEKYK